MFCCSPCASDKPYFRHKAGAASAYTFLDTVIGDDTNDGLSAGRPVKTIAQAMSVADGRASARGIYLAGGAISVTENTVIDGSSISAPASRNISKSAGYSGNIFTVSGAKLTVIDFDINGNAGETSVAVMNGTLLLDSSVSVVGTIALGGGGYLSFLNVPTENYVLATSSTLNGTVLVNARGLTIPLDKFSLSDTLSADYELKLNSDGDVCVYAKPVTPPAPVTIYTDGIIYISDSGSDDNTGATSGQPVKTYAKAAEIAARENAVTPDTINKIVLTGSVTVSSSQIWNSSAFSGGILTNGYSVIVNANLTIINNMTVRAGTGIVLYSGTLSVSSGAVITVDYYSAVGVNYKGGSLYLPASGSIHVVSGTGVRINGSISISNAVQSSLRCVTSSGGKNIEIAKTASAIFTASVTEALTVYLGEGFSYGDSFARNQNVSYTYEGLTVKNYGGSTVPVLLETTVYSSTRYMYWSDAIFLDSENGNTNTSYSGYGTDRKVKTLATALTLAEAAGVSKIIIIGTYNITADTEINEAGMSFLPYAPEGKVFTVSGGATLTLTDGTVGSVYVNGSLLYNGGEILKLEVSGGTVTLTGNSVAPAYFFAANTSTPPIIENSADYPSGNYTVNVPVQMVGQTLCASAHALYLKGASTNEKITITNGTDDVTVTGAFIYVDGVSGDDSADGLTDASPVKTLEKALSIMADGTAYTNYSIMTLGTVTYSGTDTVLNGSVTDANSETWDVTVYRAPSLTSSSVINVAENGSKLSLTNIIIDGENIVSTAALIKVNNGAELVIGAGVVIKNGYNTVSAAAAQGGGIGVYYSSKLTMNGGEISGNASDYNGSGIYVFQSSAFIMNGGTVSDNTSYNGGGSGIYISTSSSFDLNDGEISGNISKYGGGIYVKSSSALTINGGIISGNTATSTNNGGGGIYLSASCVFTMNNGEISGNYGYNGGGVYLSSSAPSFVNGGKISGNNAFSCGGGIYTSSNILNINGGEISDNTAGSGGAIYALHTPALNIYDGVISGNKAKSSGSGIYAQNSSYVNMYGGIISGNTMSGYGGGVKLFYRSVFTMNGGTISGNVTLSSGGGVNIESSSFVMNGGIISGNTSSNGGGVSLSQSSPFVMNGGVISDNAASSGGGGMYLFDQSVFTMKDGLITGNTSGYSGGGVYVSSSALIMNGGEIAGNTSSNGGGVTLSTKSTFEMNGGAISGNIVSTANQSNGGGVYVFSNSSFNMNDGVISDNTARIGGGVYVYTNSLFTMNGGKISGNTATHTGGGVLVSKSSSETVPTTFTMNNGEISGNTANFGGGVYVSSADFNIGNGTISGNTASYGNGVYLSGPMKLLSFDCIISGDIYLSSVNRIKIGGVFSDDGNTYHIVASGSTSIGTTVVEPDGILTTDASQYLSHFTHGSKALAKSGNNIITSDVRYVDGTRTEDGYGSAIYPYNTLETLRSNTIYYILGGFTTEADTTITTSKSGINIVRWTGGMINGSYYAPYTGYLFDVTNGTLTISGNINIDGKNAGSGIVNVNGGSLTLSGATTLIGQNNGAIRLNGTSAVEANGYTPGVPVSIALGSHAPGDTVVTNNTSKSYFSLVNGTYMLSASSGNLVLANKAIAVYYVSEDSGSDMNSGSESSPFATLNAAITAAGDSDSVIYIMDTQTVAADTAIASAANIQIMRYTGMTDAYMFEVTGGVLTLGGYYNITDGSIDLNGGTVACEASFRTSSAIQYHVVSPAENTVYIDETPSASFFSLSQLTANDGWEQSAVTGSTYSDVSLVSTASGTYYVSQSTGSDYYNGTSSSTPLKTLSAAYTKAKTTGAKIYIMDEYSLDEATVSETYIIENGVPVYLNRGKKITLFRYDTYTDGAVLTAGAYGNVVIKDVTIAGGSCSASTVVNSAGAYLSLENVTVSGESYTGASAVIVNNGTLKLKNISVEKADNNVSVTNNGILNIYDCVTVSGIISSASGKFITLKAVPACVYTVNPASYAADTVIADTSALGANAARSYISNFALTDTSSYTLKGDGNVIKLASAATRVRVDFNYNGGTPDTLASAYFVDGVGTLYTTTDGSATVSVPVPVKTGYTFGGWYLSDDTRIFDSDGDYVNNVSAPVTLYARWTPKTYTLSIIPNAGETVTPNALTVTYGSSGITLFTLTGIPAGYNSDGYCLSDYATRIIDDSGVLATSVPGYTDNAGNWIHDGDVTVYIMYDRIVYDITYASGANGIGTVTSGRKVYGVDFTLTSSVFTRTGYTQTGWASADGGEKVYDLGGTYTANGATTLYPVWTANTTTVTLDKNTGGADSTVTATFNGALPSFNAISKVNYKLNGYYTASSGGTKLINADGTLVSGIAGYTDSDGKWIYTAGTTLTLYAQWTEKTAVSITETAQSPVTYNGNSVSFTITGTDSGIGGFAVEYYVNGIWTVTAPTGAGNYNVKITRAEDATYKSYSYTIANGLVISKATVAVPTDSTAGSKVYTGSTLTSSISNTADYTVTANAGGINVGQYNVTVTLTDNANYKWASGTDTPTRTVKFSITQATNSFTVPVSLTGWTYGTAANTPTSTAKFGTAVYTYSDTENGTYTPAVPTTAGTHWVKASVSGNANYTLTESKVSFVIEKATVAVPTDSTAGSKVYTGSTLTSSISNTADYTVTANAGGINVGQYDVTVTLTDNANYKWASGTDTPTRTVKFSITQATNSFTVPVSITGWTYGTTANTPASTAKFGTAVYTYSDTENGTYTPTVPTTAGTHWVKASVSGNTNYTLAESKVSFIIEKATVNVPTDTMAGSKIYTGSTLTSSISNTADYTVTANAGGINVGQYDVTVTLTDNANYKWASGTDTPTRTIKFTVTQATNSFTVPVSLTGWTYGTTANTPTSTAKFGTAVYTYSDTENGTYTPAVPTTAGTHWVKASVSGNTNYTLAESKVSFIIEKATVAVPTDSTAGSKVYTGNTLTSSMPDTADYTVTANAGGINVGQYDVTVTLTDNANYKWASGTDTPTRIIKFSITQATNSFTVPVSLTGWTYGTTANTPASTAKFGTVTYSYSDTENGTYTPAVPTTAGTHWVKASVSGNTNYTSAESKISFVIEKATVAVPTDSTAGSKVYTGSTLTSSISNTADYTVTANAGGIVVGQYDVTVTLTDNANYKWASGTDTPTRTVKFSITQATNSFTVPVSLTGWTYGTTANTPASTAKFGTVVYTYSDTENGTYTPTVPTTAGTHWVKASVSGNTNYTSTDSKVSFIIEKATVAVPTDSTAGSKVYTGSTLTSSMADTADYTVTVNAGGINVGQYDVTVTLTDNANYKWASGTDTPTRTVKFTITQATNSFTVPVSLTGWTYGTTANTPASTAKFGTAVYTYSEKDYIKHGTNP